MRVLEHAKQTANVAATCRTFGVSRTRFYEWRNVAERYGLEALIVKGDRLLERLFLAHQSLDGDAHGARQLAQKQDRNVAAARLELREIALGHTGGERQSLAAHAALGAPGAHALAEAREVGVFLLLGGEGRVHEL